MSVESTAFLVMVFLAVFMLATSLMIPVMGKEAEANRRLRLRMKELMESIDPATASLLRERYLHKLSPAQSALQCMPGMERLQTILEQAGRNLLAYQLVFIALGLAAAAGIVVWLYTRHWLFAAIAALLAVLLPFVKVLHERQVRMGRFEEQLPEALDTMGRALRAGHPFAEALKLVAEELPDPIGREFGTTFTDINYGMNVKAAFLSLLQRVPSISLMAMVTAVLIQRETGGNLAEILDKIAAVVRGRFRLQRKIKTLSAEGRLSAWILTLIPFVLAVMLTITNPDYLPMLTQDATGRMLVGLAFLNMMSGVWWIRQIIRIEV